MTLVLIGKGLVFWMLSFKNRGLLGSGYIKYIKYFFMVLKENKLIYTGFAWAESESINGDS